MNNGRRRRLREAIAHLQCASSIVEQAQEDEQDAIEAVPESLQYSSQYEGMEMAEEALGEAADSIYEAISSVEEAML